MKHSKALKKQIMKIIQMEQEIEGRLKKKTFSGRLLKTALEKNKKKMKKYSISLIKSFMIKLREMTQK